MSATHPGADSQRLQFLRTVEGALRSGNLALAWRTSDEAVARGFQDAVFLTNAAYHKLHIGQVSQAIDLAQRALAWVPRDIGALNVLGLAFAKQGRHDDAIEGYKAAIRIQPDNTALHFNLACSLEEQRRNDEAKAAFERVIALQPAHAEALAHLASLTAQRGAMDVAREYAERALKLDPAQPIAHLAVGVAEVEARKYDEAYRRLVPLLRGSDLSVMGHALANGLIGDALDGLGKAEEAFPAYTRSAALQHDIYKQNAIGQEAGWERVARFATYFESVPDHTWMQRGKKDKASLVRSHVFLVGFPRSGTTLAENVLGSNARIETLEELGCMTDAVDEFVRPPDGLDRLASASDETLDRFREAYWRRVAETGLDLTRPVLIDKMPLYSIALCAIAKLFPDAKILFALRDPRDVVLSCFRRRIGMYELSTLDGAARYYDGVMNLAEVYRRKIDLPIYDLRYETVVSDFENEIQRVCDFIGVEWDEGMRDFTRRAAVRPINTPSASQVARGLYSGADQWRAYEKGLAPVLPILDRWIKRYGYEADESAS